MSFHLSRILPFAALASLAALTPTPARAVIVTYTTAGAFTCGGVAGCTLSTNSTTDDTMTVTQNGVTEILTYSGSFDSVATPSTTFFGDVISCNQIPDSCTPGSVAPGVSLTGSGLTLTVNQTVPGTASGNFTGNLTGNLFFSGSTVQLDFTNPTLTLGQVVYSLDNNGIFPVPPPNNCNNGCGDVTITGSVDTVTPEPALLGLTGLGFAGLLAARFRRRRSA